jgi:hypothetical protein
MSYVALPAKQVLLASNTAIQQHKGFLASLKEEYIAQKMSAKPGWHWFFFGKEVTRQEAEAAYQQVEYGFSEESMNEYAYGYFLNRAENLQKLALFALSTPEQVVYLDAKDAAFLEEWVGESKEPSQ